MVFGQYNIFKLYKDSLKYETRFKDSLEKLARNNDGWFYEHEIKNQLINIGVPVDTPRERYLAKSLFNKLKKGIKYHHIAYDKDRHLEDMIDETMTIKLEKSGVSFFNPLYRFKIDE